MKDLTQFINYVHSQTGKVLRFKRGYVFSRRVIYDDDYKPKQITMWEFYYGSAAGIYYLGRTANTQDIHNIYEFLHRRLPVNFFTKIYDYHHRVVIKYLARTHPELALVYA